MDGAADRKKAVRKAAGTVLRSLPHGIPDMKKNLLAAILAASLAGVLAGCSSLPGGDDEAQATAAVPADESKEFKPVSYDQVCLLENSAVKSPKLVEAIEAGLKRSGAEVKRLEPGTSPKACPFVLTYEVAAQNGVITAVVFQTFENGIPRMQASGSAPKGRGLTVAMAAGYAHELLGRLKGTYKQAPKPAQQPAQAPAQAPAAPAKAK